MKKILTFCFLFSLLSGFSQTLSQKEFNLILEEVKNITRNIKKPQDFNVFAEQLNLNKEQLKKIIQSFKGLDLDFNNQNSKDHILPFFTKSQNDKFLFLNLATLTSHPTKSKKEFPRGTYYFTFYCYVGVVNNKVIFKGAKVLSEEDIIHKWFLSIYPVYLKETKIIHNKYNFVPPPPFPAPISLKRN